MGVLKERNLYFGICVVYNKSYLFMCWWIVVNNYNNDYDYIIDNCSSVNYLIFLIKRFYFIGFKEDDKSLKEFDLRW